jgi:hypothetical protein
MTDCSAVANVRARILKRASDPRLVFVPGLADDLKLIGEAFGTLEHHVQALARATLAKSFGYDISPGDYNELVALGREVDEDADG